MQHFTYAFACMAHPERSYEVIAFHGQEQLDACFEFTLKLRTDAAGFSSEPLLNARASLSISQGGERIKKNGRISRVHVLRTYAGKCYLECVLVPSLHTLALARNYRTFINTPLDSALEQLFQDCGLEQDAYAFRLTQKAPLCAYLCQYDESDLDFLLRRLAQYGWSFFFEYAGNRDILVVTDSLGTRNDCPDHSDHSGPTLRFAPPGSDHPDAGRLVQRFTRKVQAVPQSVRFKDWNYERPDLRLEAQVEASATGFGETYVFGHTPGTPQGVRDRATLLAEKLGTLADLHMGGSDSPLLLPGQTFTLKGHPADAFNTRYLPLFIEHTGRAAMRDVAHPAPPGYSNRFVAVRADRAYRPLQTVPEPRVAGGLHGFVESESTTYAQLDAHGRYRVKLCFDNAERQPGKSSPPLRLLSPHAGNACGLHFPLQGGAEVLVAHEYGDPDRPVIMGALPNAEAPGPVADATAHTARIATPGGNRLHFDDTQGHPFISAHCPKTNASMLLGDILANDGADAGADTGKNTEADSGKGGGGKDSSEKWGTASYFGSGISYSVPYGLLHITAGAMLNVCVGAKASLVCGWKHDSTLEAQSIIIGDQATIQLGPYKDFKGSAIVTKTESKLIGIVKKDISTAKKNLVKKWKKAVLTDTEIVERYNNLINNNEGLSDKAEIQFNKKRIVKNVVKKLINKEKATYKQTQSALENEDELIATIKYQGKNLTEIINEEVQLIDKQITKVENNVVAINDESGAVEKQDTIADEITRVFGEMSS